MITRFIKSGTTRLPDLQCKHLFASSKCSFRGYITDVSARETFPAAGRDRGGCISRLWQLLVYLSANN